jgi:hypothetical protein
MFLNRYPISWVWVLLHKRAFLGEVLDSLEEVVCKPVAEGVHRPGVGEVVYGVEVVGEIMRAARDVLVELG